MNRKLYRKLAKKHGVSVAEVKHEMQEVIKTAYLNPDKSPANIKAQDAIFCKGDIPTPEELIRYAVDEVGRRKSE